MFTGIITHLGKLKHRQDSIFKFEVPSSLSKKVQEGTSIAVNGVCLTVLEKPVNNTIRCDVMPETLRRTALNSLPINTLVNLELPATANDFLSGHIVQGHIDAAGTIQKISSDGNSKLLTISVPQQLNKYIVEKGSIAVNGVSLTVMRTSSEDFIVGIIPYTWEHTMLHQLKTGDLVNIETDILARYIEKLAIK